MTTKTKTPSVVDALLAAAGLTPREATNPGVRVRILQIGPAEAKALLAANTDNRPLRPGRVRLYARMMKAGDWPLTHQGIAFSSTGGALDLQHRMHAVIEAGVEVQVMVTEGLPPEVFEKIDQHERRSMADALRMSRHLIEVAKFLLKIGGGDAGAHPTPREVDEAASAIEREHTLLREACPTQRTIVSTAPFRAAACVLMVSQPLDEAQIVAKYRSLVLHQTEAWTPAMHALGRQIAQGKLSSDSAGRADLFCRAMIALNPARDGVTKIQVKDESLEAHRLTVAKIVGSRGG